MSSVLLQINTPQLQPFYGVALLLVGVLVVAVAVLWVAFHRQIRFHRYELVDIIFKTIEAMNLVSNNLEKLRDANEDDAQLLREAFERLRSDLIQKLNSLDPKSAK